MRLSMKYIEDFIKYLKVVKKDSNYTLVNYKNDLLELYDFYTDIINIDKLRLDRTGLSQAQM